MNNPKPHINPDIEGERLFDKKMLNQKRAEYIKHYRTEVLKMSLSEVQKKFGIDRGYVSRMENAKVAPKIYWK